jgi:peroxiredoxin (alkyl hydroperoxide reductase subunit C)
MTEDLKVGCARPTGGPVGKEEKPESKEEKKLKTEGGKMIKVGQKAPDFTAPAYFKGKFVNVKLSDI